MYELAPHVFALAEDTYRALLAEHKDQCVIISRESGAGKTEASKKIMQYIAAVTGSGPEIERVKNQILQSNPILEAFGLCHLHSLVLILSLCFGFWWLR